MSSLESHLKTLIAQSGPLSVADYMTAALSHPKYGYYTSKIPFGQKGDFITAPEISQFFGELIGAWCIQCWMELGRPAKFHWVELGPGRGTCMADMMRTARKVAPDFLEAASIHLIESSPILQEEQRKCLEGEIVWHAKVQDVPEGPTIIVANEFFDALPIRQFVKTEDGWHERVIGLSEERLCFGLSPGPIPQATIIPPTAADEPAGQIFERSPLSQTIAANLGDRVSRFGGAGLIIDYGHIRSAPGDTLQAVRAHKRAGVLDDPGTCDLTAHVDFEKLSNSLTSSGAVCFGPVEQGTFLERLGIHARVDQVAKSLDNSKASELRSGVDRLTHADKMGTLFKVLGFTGEAGLVPAGFEK